VLTGGLAQTAQDDSGGGSGGSVWLTAGQLTGGGTITAKGGDGELYGGGGGGGRIALYSPMNTFTGTVSVVGGAGAFPGGAGTVHSASTLLPFAAVSHSPAGLVSNAVSALTIEFNGPINPESVDGNDITILTPYGSIAHAQISASSTGPLEVRFTFPAQNVPGDYQLRVRPGIQDVFGQAMSQVYTGSFAVVLPLISGTVTNSSGEPVAGVLLQPSGGLLPAQTDLTGAFALGVPPGWNGTVTPESSGFMFVPGSRNYGDVTDSISGADFLILPTIAPAVELSGAGAEFGLGWHGISGVSYQVQWSTNLVNWHLLGTPLAGTNGPLHLPIMSGGAPAMFFRVQAQN
jgi:hypothetical protein